MATFVLNDESKTNSYGFRVRNAGIDLSRFLANPIMLDQHWNSTSSVLGRWKNVRIDGSRLLADDEFDLEDEAAKKIHGKVERGIITGASMGVTFDRDNMQLQADGSYELVQCELFEASIVAIPSNASALRLYATAGALLLDAEIQTVLQTLSLKSEHKTANMKKITLSIAALAALGMTAQPNEDEVGALSAAIESLKARYDAEKTARETLEKKISDQLKLQADALVNEAVQAGKLTADVKEQFVQMAIANYELAAKVIGGMPAKASLAGTVTNTPPKEVKTVDDFAALTLEEQLKFKETQPDAYKKLFA